MRAVAFAWFCVALALPSGDTSPAPQLRVIEVDFYRAEAEAERWGVEGIPVVIVLSDRGELLLRANGASRQTLSALKSGLEELVNKPRKRSPP